MKILVTGATGFLGAQLLVELEHSAVCIYGVSSKGTETTIGCDLTDMNSVKILVDHVQPDLIIHCAAHVPRKLCDYQDEFLGKSNMIMTKNILDTSRCPIIYISSMTIYGKSRNGPISESEICAPINKYARSKFECERMINESDRQGFAVRIPGLFGMPRMSGLVYNLISSALTGKDITLPQLPILWSGIHVVDAAQGIVSLVKHATQSFSVVNLGCVGLASVSSLIDLVNHIYGSKIVMNLKHPSFEFDLTRYQLLTGLPVVSLRDCLERFGNEIDV